MIKKLKTKLLLSKLGLVEFGWVPNAWRNIDNTIIILVNAVMPRTNEGRTVSAVIKTNICSDNEYVVSPFVVSKLMQAFLMHLNPAPAQY